MTWTESRAYWYQLDLMRELRHGRLTPEQRALLEAELKNVQLIWGFEVHIPGPESAGKQPA
jgi:hypothetical protein